MRPVVTSESTPKVRAWLYCRVQEHNDTALEAQRIMLLEYAESKSWDVVGITTEKCSGLDIHRPGLVQIAKSVTYGKVDVVLVFNTSRLCRATVNLLRFWKYLYKHHVRLVSLLNGEEDYLMTCRIYKGIAPVLTDRN